jgi:RNA polymerase sigma-70 factor, ECF subfamily
MLPGICAKKPFSGTIRAKYARNFASCTVFQIRMEFDVQVSAMNAAGKSAHGAPQSRDRDRENAEDILLFREFVEGLRAGSPEGSRIARQAFTKIYLRYRERVYAYALRVLCNQDDAQDLFQEVFFRVYTRAASFEEEKSLGGWIFTIAHNLCLNKVRDRKPQENLEDAARMTDHALVTLPPDDLGENWRDRIEWAMGQLPVEYREAIVLREYEGLSYNEITEIMHTTIPAVKSRIYRAKARLRELLEPYYKEELK